MLRLCSLARARSVGTVQLPSLVRHQFSSARPLHIATFIAPVSCRRTSSPIQSTINPHPCLIQSNAPSKLNFHTSTSGLKQHQSQSGTSSPPPPPPPPSEPTSSSNSDSRSRRLLRIALYSAVVLIAASSVGLIWIRSRMEPCHRLTERAATLSTFTNSIIRLWRDLYCAGRIYIDYELTLRSLDEKHPSSSAALSAVHLRSALRLRDVMSRNGGLYIKFAQHIAMMRHLLPDEYVETMQPMLNQAPVSSYEDISRVFREDFGKSPEDVFYEFDPKPIAAASLAQVHFATLRSETDPTQPGERVAVKIQHSHLAANSASDIATVRFIIHFLHKLDHRFDYTWLSDEIAENLPLECDFAHEARNAEKARQNLDCDHRDDVDVPRIHWPLTSHRVLCMQRMDGCLVNDVAALKRMGIAPNDVSQTISKIFSEQIFIHGFVHCDPHAGNLLVRRRSPTDARPQVILLDHGLYRELSDEFRLAYAHLWDSLIRGDKEGIKTYAQKMNAGDMYPLFAAMLTRKPFHEITSQNKDKLVLKNDEDERRQLQEWAMQYAEEVQTILARIPKSLILLLKTNDCLRAIDRSLGTPANSFLILARYCNMAINEEKRKLNPGLRTWLSTFFSSLSMEARLQLFSLMVWLSTVLNRLTGKLQPTPPQPTLAATSTVVRN